MRDAAGLVLAFGPAIVALGAVQGLTVLAPGAGWPSWLWRPQGRWWALIAPCSIGVVIGGIAADSSVADFLTWLALIAIPPLAACALGWGIARPLPSAFAAACAAGLLGVAIAGDGHVTGDVAALVLTALGCITLGRLVAGLAPAILIKLGLVITAIVDSILVFGQTLQAPNALLNAAAPAAHLPKLQFVAFGPAQMGFGDVFVAALLGATLAAEGRSTRFAAAATFIAATLMDLGFYVTDTLPATVPIGVVVLLIFFLDSRRRADPARP